MKKYIFILCSLVLASSFCLTEGLRAEDRQKSGTNVSVLPERKTGVYKTGEKIGFKVSITKDGAPVTTGKIEYDLLVDCVKKSSGSTEFTGGSAFVSSELSGPGTLMIVVNYTDNGKKITGKAGAIADPFEIKPSLPAPTDFDEFWEKQKKKLAAVPMNPKLTKVDGPKASYGSPVECYHLELDCIGDKPVRGYFAKPAGAKPKSLPATLLLPSAGIRDSRLSAAFGSAKNGMLALDLNAHGLPGGKPAEFYTGLANGELKDCWNRGLEDPENIYLYGMFMRMVRAIDFLISQPEWDGKTLITSGGSQGGGLAIEAGGLDSRVTEIIADAPWCDVTSFYVSKNSAWSGSAANKKEKASQYYDAWNFAARTKAKASFIVGLVDTTCPATGILSAYNQIKGEKKIIILPLRGHAGTTESQKMAKDPDYSH
jgi:cephalosporin-C deacetylase